MTNELICNYDCISLFNDRLYKDIFTRDNIVSKKKCLMIGSKKFYGFYLEKGLETFFAPDEYIVQLPFRIIKKVEHDYKGDVFTFITKIEPVDIPAEKRMSFKKLIDTIGAFKHSKPLHFLIYKIIAITARVDRINARITTDKGFGKDSIVSIQSGLTDSTYNMYGGTFAKIEYALTNKLIVLNELGNLKPDDKHNFQEFLLATGGFSNVYIKRSRKTALTQESYNISKLSLLVFYNLPTYYTSKNQEYFDQMFTGAVTDRFTPFVFEGYITTKFNMPFDISEVVTENEQIYKDIIATILYYEQNPIKELKFKVDTEVIKFPEECNRHERSFYTILKYLGEYCDSPEQFDMMSKEMYNCYKAYEKFSIFGGETGLK